MAAKQKTEESLKQFITNIRRNDFTAFSKSIHKTMDQTIKTEKSNIVGKK